MLAPRPYCTTKTVVWQRLSANCTYKFRNKVKIKRQKVRTREGNVRGGCEGGSFSERSSSLALPPEERLGISLSFPPGLRPHARWGAVPCYLIVVTAADRAAATCQHAPLFQARARSYAHQQASPERGGARRRRAEGFVPPRRTVAAALSAAVTSRKPIGDTPNLQAEPTPKQRTKPIANRSSGVGVWGRGASL